MPGDAPTKKGPPPVIVATGVDLVELSRVEELLSAQRDRFLARVYTPAEIDYCDRQARPTESYAARFAAKEAVMKCLGTGWADGVAFTDVEVVRVDGGAVGIRVTGRSAEVAAERGIARFHLSLSHTDQHAIAFAVAER